MIWSAVIKPMKCFSVDRFPSLISSLRCNVIKKNQATEPKKPVFIQ